MRRTFLLFGVVTFFLCQKAVSQSFVQSESIQLAKPKLEISSKIIDQEEKISLIQGELDTQVFYTIGGEAPTTASFLYQGPIGVKEPDVYKFKAFHKYLKASEVTEVRLVKMGHQVDSIIWISEAGEKYPGVGLKTLVNHKKAHVSFSDPQWMGFDHPIEFVLMFDSKKYIRSIDIGFLADPASWIFPPDELIVSISENQNDFTESKKLIFKELESMVSAKSESTSIALGKEVKTLRIQIKNVNEIPSWHEGKGSKAWMFLDELIFYE